MEQYSWITWGLQNITWIELLCVKVSNHYHCDHWHHCRFFEMQPLNVFNHQYRKRWDFLKNIIPGSCIISNYISEIALLSHSSLLKYFIHRFIFRLTNRKNMPSLLLYSCWLENSRQWLFEFFFSKLHIKMLVLSIQPLY